MILVDAILGNSKQDTIWHKRLNQCSVDVLPLTQWEAQKSRIRKSSQKGKDIGLSLDRNQILNDGDVLLWDEANKHIVIVKIELRKVLIIKTKTLLTKTPEEIAKISFNLGHTLGNQHWKAVFKDNEVFIPVTVDEKVIELTLKTHNFNLDYLFVRGEEILPKLTHSEVRLLFGGAENSETHVHVHHHHEAH